VASRYLLPMYVSVNVLYYQYMHQYCTTSVCISIMYVTVIDFVRWALKHQLFQLLVNHVASLHADKLRFISTIWWVKKTRHQSSCSYVEQFAEFFHSSTQRKKCNKMI